MSHPFCTCFFCLPEAVVDRMKVGCTKGAVGQNRIRSFLYMGRILEFVYIRGNKDTILFIYGKTQMRKSPHFGTVLHRGFLTRQSTKISQCLKIARYKEVSAIKKVHYREVLPFDEFIIQQFSINRTCVRYFDRNSALFNFCIQVINGVNLISRYNKSWFKNCCSGRSCNILKGSF